MKLVLLRSTASERLGVRKAIPIICSLVAVLLICAPLFSQTANGRISGAVKDQTGGAIVGAMVTVTDVARGLARNLSSDEAGAYLAPNLLPGTYTVRVTFTGFQAWERTNILLEVGGELAIDAVLQPGAQTQTVTVTEELPLVNTTSATLGGTFSNETINELPINGRNYQNLQELRPGVVLNLANDSNGAGAASVNGIRPESSNEYLVEGLHVMDPYTGQSVINNIGVNGDAATILPIDAIQEFNAQYNPKAEYGFKAGGSVGIGLKSGTNALHGTGLAFFRADALDARSYFNTADQPKVNGNLRQWGATLGGPIKKDKLFFFLAYEQQNLTVGNPSRVEAPFTDPALLSCTTGPYACTPIANSVAGSKTPDASNHFILGCLLLPAASRSPQSLSMVGLNPDCSPGANYPNPNFFVPHGATDHGAANASNPTITSYFPNTQTNTLALGSLAKVDYQLNSQNSVNGFFYKGVGESRDGQTNVRPEWRGYFHYHALVGAGSWTWLPNSRMANSLRIGYAYLHQPAEGVDTGDHPDITAAKLGIATGVTESINAGLPTITPNGFYALGSRQTEIQGPMTSLELNDQVSYLQGNHSLKFGGSIIAEHQNGALWQNAKGSFAFGSGGNGVPAFLAGQCIPLAAGGCSNPVPAVPVSGGTPIAAGSTGGLQTVTFLYGDPRSHVNRTTYSFFVQDDFRIRPRLTVNLGIRYELSSVLRDRDHILGGFDPNVGIVQEGNQIPAIMNPDKNNFSPRVGFAWDMQGNGKTVLRASGSIINELVTMRTYLDITPSLAQMPTAWIIGCSGTITTADLDGATSGTQTIAAGATSNCGGTLVTSGGTRDAGTVSYTASAGTLAPVSWDGPINGTSASILPTAGLHSCSPTVAVADVIKPTAQIGRFGAPCTINFADRRTASPYVESWNLSIQRALRSNVSLEVAYVGNHGVKLIGKTDLNQAPTGPAWNTVSGGRTLLQICNANMTVASCQAGSLGGNQTLYTNTLNANRTYFTKFPYLQAINRIWNRDVSNYDGLQVSLTARNFHGFSSQAGYTWAHALDIGSDNTSGAGSDAYNNNLDYGSANSDLRHRFTFAPAYNVPGRKGFGGLLEGWRLNGNFKYQTGRSWTPTDSRDFYGTGKGSRWDFFGDYSDFKVDLVKGNNAGFYPGCPAVAGVASCTTLPALAAGATCVNSTTVACNPRTGLAFVAADLAVNNTLCTGHAASVATLTAFGCWTQGNSVLTPPALNTFGNTTKGRFRGPIFWNVDMSVTKKQPITERLSAEFRGEFFNPFNHPNFSQPTGTSVNSCAVGACTFGQTSNTPNVTATNALIGSGGPRRIQFGIKLIF